jgi:hypothetical protein
MGLREFVKKLYGQNPDVKPKFEKLRLSQITPDLIEEFKDDRHRGSMACNREQGSSGSSKNAEASGAKTIYCVKSKRPPQESEISPFG